MTRPVVHGFSGSPFVWRTLMVLDEKGVDHDRRWIARASGSHRSPEMLALNPRGKLPVLEWEGSVVYESIATCLFLERVRPEPPLLPASTAECARAMSRTMEVENYLVGAAMPALEHGLMRKPGAPVSDAQRAANRTFMDELVRWDEMLAQTGDFLAGSSFSLADVALFPLAAFMVRCRFALGDHAPRLSGWYERLEARPSVQSSWPPHWRESEGSDIGLNER